MTENFAENFVDRGCPTPVALFATEPALSKRQRAEGVGNLMLAVNANQCAATTTSPARPGGGTTTVDKLPSAVSF